MSVYVDTSLLVPMFLADPFNARVRAFESTRPSIIVSTWAEAEFTTTVGIRLRALGVTVEAA